MQRLLPKHALVQGGAMAEQTPVDLGAVMAVEAAALPTLRPFEGLWRRRTAVRQETGRPWPSAASCHASIALRVVSP